MASTFRNHGLITGMRPANGGWEFPQPWEGSTITIQGDDADDLLKKVTVFRVENAMELGDPCREISEYIKAKSPANNGKRRSWSEPPGGVVTSVREVVPMIEFIKAWLIGMLKRGDIVLAREELAIQRSTVCANCPQNIKWQVSCGPCNDDVDYKSNQLRQRPRFTLDKKLRACRLHRIALQSAVFLDRELLPPRHKDAPEPCWIANEQT